MFNMDTTKQLEQHSTSDKATFAYYFTELFKPSKPSPLWNIPDWLKKKADHADELPFVFGLGSILTELEQTKSSLWEGKLSCLLIFEIRAK